MSAARRYGVAARFAPLALGVLMGLAACADGFFHAPAFGGPAGLAVRLAAGPLAGSQADAFDRADRLLVRLDELEGGETVFQQDQAFASEGSETRVSLEVPLDEPEATLRLTVALHLGTAALFVGTGTVTLTAGEATEAEMELAPVPTGVVAEALEPFTALGDFVELEAAVVMATGDTIEGARPTEWRSLDPDVVSIDPQVGGPVTGWRATARGEGATELVATYAVQVGGETVTFEDRVAAEVAPDVASVDVDPSSLVIVVGEEATLAATVRDRNGNVLIGRTVAWSSSDEGVATVDAEGVVTGVEPGTVTVTAAVGSVAGEAQVRVDAPPPPPGPTGLGVAWDDGVVLTWTDESGGTASFEVERAVTPVGPPASAGQTGPFERIATLPPGTTRFVDPAPVPGELAYRVRACNSFVCSDATDPVSFLYQTAPLAVTDDATAVLAFEATLNGRVDARGLATVVYFEWDLNPSFTQPSFGPSDGIAAGSGYGEVPVSYRATDLPSGTTLYTRVVAINDAGITYGNAVSFTTGGAPLVVTDPATQVEAVEATLNGRVDPRGLPTVAYFEWDFSPTFSEPSIEPSDGIAVGSGTGPVPVSFLATGLPSIATLYYRIVAFNDAGITYGNTVSFTTDTLGFAVPAELAPASGGEGGGADAALARDYPTQSVVRRGAPVSSWTTRSAMRSPARPSP
jgi:hypothetical protein